MDTEVVANNSGHPSAIGTKRKREETTSGIDVKREKKEEFIENSTCTVYLSNIGDSINDTCVRKEYGLLDFPDDILLMILARLTHSDILVLSQTCERLNRLCQYHALWRNVEFLTPANKDELTNLLNFVGDKTISILCPGHIESETNEEEFKVVLTEEWMSTIAKKCPKLTILSLQGQFIDCSLVSIQSFPSSLTKLDLSSTKVRNEPVGRSYFRDICNYLPNLEVLILSNCLWFEPHSLMALSKCPKLEELRLDGCEKVKDCVAYSALATRQGFKSLQTLDLRRCPLGTTEIMSFASVHTITNMYLEKCEDGENIHIDDTIQILFTNEPMIEIRAHGHPGNLTYPRLKIQRLILQNYQLSERTLLQLARDALYLKYLDVSRCPLSKEALIKFEQMRPDVKFIHSELNGLQS